MLARLIAAAMIAAAPAAVSAQALADRVPANSAIYLGWRGSEDLGPAYDKSNLKGFLDDSNIPELFDQFLPGLFEKAGDLGGPEVAKIGGVIKTIGKPMWKHPTALFIADLETKEGELIPHMGLLCMAGEDGADLEKQLNDLLGQDKPPFPVNVIHKGKLVALIVGYEDADAALPTGGAKSLAGDPTFQKSLAQVGKAPAAAAYVDISRALEIADKVMSTDEHKSDRKSWEQTRDVFGLRQLKQFICASGFEGTDWGSQAFLAAPAPRTGLLAMLDGKPLSDEILATIPKTSTFAGAARFNVARFVGTMLESIRKVDPKSAPEMDKDLEKVARETGVDLQKDLLASLGDEWAYFTDPNTGGRGVFGFTVVNRLKDPAHFEESLLKMQDYAVKQIAEQGGDVVPVTFKFYDTQVDRMKIHYLGLPMIAPSWVVKDGVLYAGLYPQVVASAARRGADKKTSILQNESYMALRQRLGVEKIASLDFKDLPRTAPDAYGWWLAIGRLSGFGDVFGIKSPPMIMPELGKLLTHLSAAGQITWSDDSGFHGRSISPFPGAELVASDPWLLMAYAEPAFIAGSIPAMGNARESARQVKSASNLRQIGQAAMLYANDHKNQFPESIAQLATEEDLSADVFLNPRTDHPAPPAGLKGKDLGDWVSQHSDYVWLGAGKTSAEGAESVLAYEKIDDASDQVNLLYGDGHVEMIPKADAQKQILDSMKPKSPPAPDM